MSAECHARLATRDCSHTTVIVPEARGMLCNMLVSAECHVCCAADRGDWQSQLRGKSWVDALPHAAIEQIHERLLVSWLCTCIRTSYPGYYFKLVIMTDVRALQQGQASSQVKWTLQTSQDHHPFVSHRLASCCSMFAGMHMILKFPLYSPGHKLLSACKDPTAGCMMVFS